MMLIANGPPRGVSGKPSMEYVATLVNPVDKRLYDVVTDEEVVYIVAPMPNAIYKSEDERLQVYGSGAYAKYEELELTYAGDTSTYYRSHTPAGVVKKSSGLGLMLYSGISLATQTSGGYDVGGIYSSMEDRSPEATRWWKAQVDRDFAEQDGKSVSGYGQVTVDVDEETLGDIEDLAGRGYFGNEMEDAENVYVSDYSPSSFEVEVYVDGDIEVQFLPAVKVAEAKLVVAWNTEEEELNDLMSESVELPPPEVLSELDLKTVGDANLILNLWDVLVEQGATEAQKRKFLKHVPSSFSVVPEILELQGQQQLPFDEVLEDARQEVAANPRPKVQHSKAWKNYFGELSVQTAM